MNFYRDQLDIIDSLLELQNSNNDNMNTINNNRNMNRNTNNVNMNNRNIDGRNINGRNTDGININRDAYHRHDFRTRQVTLPNRNIEPNRPDYQPEVNPKKHIQEYVHTYMPDPNLMLSTSDVNDKFKSEIEQDNINNHLMSRLNSDLYIKKCNDRKKKDVIMKPFSVKGPSIFDNKSIFNDNLKQF